MSKQVMQRALDALTLARSQLDVLWVSHHANRTDAALSSADAAIEALRAAIAQPEVEPVAFVSRSPNHVSVSWIGKTEWPNLTKLFTTPPDTEAMRRDAERYRWLCNAKGLELRSDGSNWCKHGGKFIAPFSMAANGTRYGAFSSLDEMIDAAIAAQGGGE